MAVEVAGARRRFAREEYYQMAEVGILKPTDRVELIRGEIVEMSPIARRHQAFVDNLAQLLIMRVAGRAIVSVQNPLVLAEDTEPEPDLKILRRRSVPYKELEAHAVDCAAESVEVHRTPQAGSYRDVSRLTGVAPVNPLAFPDIRVTLAEIFA